MVVRYDPNTEKLIVQEATKLEYNQCKLWLNRHVKGYKFLPAFKIGAWDGKIDFFNNGQINIGLWKELVKAMKEIGSNFQIQNKEDFPIDRDITLEKVQEFCDDFFENHYIEKDGEKIKFSPRDYQVETAFKILKNKFTLSAVATSGGKTLIMSIVMFYILENIDPDAKFLIITPAISLVTQAYDEFVSFNTAFGKGHEKQLDIRIEEIMSSTPRKYSGAKDPNVYISCYQSITEWDKDWFLKFDAVMVDEAHQAKSKSLVTILEKTFTNAKYRFGVSGTFPDEMSCEILTIQSILGPILSDISAKKLIKEGSISPLDIKVMYLNHEDKSFDMILKTIRKNPNRAIEAYQAEKEYIQKSDKRIAFIKKLISKCTKNTLLLFNSIEYGTKLLEELEKEKLDNVIFYYIDGSISGKNREVIKKEMEILDGKVRILVASFGTLSTGISIKNLYNIVFTESFKSESRIIQSIGRGLRLHSTEKVANIFDLVDQFIEENPRNAYFKHGEERTKMYRKHHYPYKEIKFNL
jgi:superfamily II DNA or RNA helicase